jgi:hypothetical protein
MTCPFCKQLLLVPLVVTKETDKSNEMEGPTEPSQWYYSKDGQQLGPVPLSKLQALVKTGSIRPTDFVWQQGMPQWTQVAHVNVLFASTSVFSGPAPRPPLLVEAPFSPPMSPMQQSNFEGPHEPFQNESRAGKVCSILSVVFGGVAFIFCPPLFGLAGLVLGIRGVVLSKNKALGIVGIVLSVIGAVVGMFIATAIVFRRG